MEITKKFLSDHKSITNVIFTFEFEPIEQIQREIYTFERNFKPLFPDEAIDTRVPQDFNPITPRFILRHDKKKRYLEVSQDRAVLKFIITGDHATDPPQGLLYFKQKCESVLEIIRKLISPKFYQLGSSTSLHYSLKDYAQSEISQFYSNRFLNHQNIVPPKKFAFTADYEEAKKYLISLNFQEYEQLNFKIDAKDMGHQAPGSIKVIRLNRNTPNVDIQDYGLQIIVNVNNSLMNDITGIDVNPAQSLEDISKITLDRVNSMEDFLI